MRKLFSSTERQLAEAISSLTFINPFIPARADTERAVLGSDYVTADTSWNFVAARGQERPNETRLRKKVTACVNEWRRRLGTGIPPATDEWNLYQDAVVFDLYYSIEDDLFRLLMDNPPRPPLKDVYARFLARFQQLLNLPSKNLHSDFTPEHLFACCHQVSRAFQGIYRSIIGFSPCMIRLRAAVWESIFTHDMRRYYYHLYRRMRDISTLILGPSGAGKERVAQALAKAQYVPFDPKTHRFADSADNLFSTTVLSALSPYLIESELFGHVQGAFTGAVKDRIGRLESCSPHGALFLDEIGDADPQIQVKLLRVLQYRTFERVGENVPRQFQGKIIAATNRELPALMHAGKFREDFYFRLCSDVITAPSLRQQISESPRELDNLIDFITAGLIDEPRARHQLNEDVRAWVRQHPGYEWPGNFRELEQCIRNILLRRTYYPPLHTDTNRIDEQLRRIASVELDERQLLGFYSTLAYTHCGSYQAAAQKLGVNWRTIKARVDPALLENRGPDL